MSAGCPCHAGSQVVPSSDTSMVKLAGKVGEVAADQRFDALDLLRRAEVDGDHVGWILRPGGVPAAEQIAVVHPADAIVAVRRRDLATGSGCPANCGSCNRSPPFGIR